MQFNGSRGRFSKFRHTIISCFQKGARLIEVLQILNETIKETDEPEYKYESLQSHINRDPELRKLFEESLEMRKMGTLTTRTMRSEVPDDLINKKLEEMGKNNDFVAYMLVKYGEPDNPKNDKPFDDPLNLTYQSFKIMARALMVIDHGGKNIHDVAAAQRVYIKQIEFLVLMHGSNAIEGFSHVNFNLTTDNINEDAMNKLSSLLDTANTQKATIGAEQETLFK